jgi:hypothetical protein
MIGEQEMILKKSKPISEPLIKLLPGGWFLLELS